MAIYMSRGTIQATISFDGGKSDQHVKFIPTPDYYIKHKTVQYAAFVQKHGSKANARLKALDSVSLRCEDSCLSVAAIAAATNVQVEIEVEIEPISSVVKEWKITGITIPAK